MARSQYPCRTLQSLSRLARAFSDRNESLGIPKTARVRFKLHAGEGGQHVWPRRFRLIFVEG